MSDIRQYIVSGRVQGVGFRAATSEQARQLDLAGWVCNRSDGTVELLAAGTPAALDSLRDWLDVGPPEARVIAVEPQDTAADPDDLPYPFAVR